MSLICITSLQTFSTNTLYLIIINFLHPERGHGRRGGRGRRRERGGNIIINNNNCKIYNNY